MKNLKLVMSLLFFTFAPALSSAQAEDTQKTIELNISEIAASGDLIELTGGVVMVLDCNNYSMSGSWEKSLDHQQIEFKPKENSIVGTRIYCPEVKEEQFVEALETLVVPYQEMIKVQIPQNAEVRIQKVSSP